MPRTDSGLVASIMEMDEDEYVLDPFIEVANTVVTARCLSAGYSVEELELIERYLTCHLYSLDRTRLKEETIGRSREVAQTKEGLGLDLTHHGQQLKWLFDWRGTLSKRRVNMVWLGRTRRERMTDPRYGWYYYP
jgi:hypothetical protein